MPVRRAARLLVLDADDALLLIEGFDPDDPGAGTWWFTPGGGLEADESFEDAARRELREETGAIAGDLVEVGSERYAEFAFGGQQFRQTERFFAVRLARFDPVATELTDLERRSHLRPRWWTLAEFDAERPVAFPPDLRDRWESALRLAPL
jgi:8-oxo-dGTP pyrophosphatase MutT (NUDIX family)